MSAEKAPRPELPLDIKISAVRNDLLRSKNLDASKFTEDALDKLDDQLAADITCCVEGAKHNARRDKSEIVRAADVENAILERNKPSRRNKLWVYVGLFGGAILSTGIQMILTVPDGTPIDRTQLLCAAGLVIVGAIVVGMTVVAE
jgi:hypothetical protein